MAPDVPNQKNNFFELRLAYLIALLFLTLFPLTARATTFTSFRELSYQVRLETPESPGEWQSSGPLWENPLVGYSTTNRLWIRATIPNPSSHEQHLLLDFAERSLSSIDLYLSQPTGDVQHLQGGWAHPSGSRPNLVPFPIIELCVHPEGLKSRQSSTVGAFSEDPFSSSIQSMPSPTPHSISPCTFQFLAFC